MMLWKIENEKYSSEQSRKLAMGGRVASQNFTTDKTAHESLSLSYAQNKGDSLHTPNSSNVPLNSDLDVIKEDAKK